MRWFVALGSMVLVAIGFSQGPAPGPLKNGSGPQQQPTHKPNSADTSKPPAPFVAPVTAVGSVGDAHKEGYDAGKKEAGSGDDIWTIVSALSPLAVGLMTGWLIWKQIKLGQRLNDLTRQSADAATEAAKAATAGLKASKQLALQSRTDTEASLALTRQSADAAVKSADATEKILQHTSRPWIMFRNPEVTIPDPPQPGVQGMVRVLVTNYGPNPALMLALGTTIRIGPVPPDPKEILPILFAVPSCGAIGPDGKDVARLEPQVISSVVPFGNVVYLVAASRYNDALGGIHDSVCTWKLDSGILAVFYAPELHYYT